MINKEENMRYNDGSYALGRVIDLEKNQKTFEEKLTTFENILTSKIINYEKKLDLILDIISVLDISPDEKEIKKLEALINSIPEEIFPKINCNSYPYPYNFDYDNFIKLLDNLIIDYLSKYKKMGYIKNIYSKFYWDILRQLTSNITFEDNYNKYNIKKQIIGSINYSFDFKDVEKEINDILKKILYKILSTLKNRNQQTFIPMYNNKYHI
jgi:hypothetical protein